MKKRCVGIMLVCLLAVLSAGCGEGKPIDNDPPAISEGYSEKGTAGQSADLTNDTGGDAGFWHAEDTLQLRHGGGTYRVEKWELYKGLQATGISEEHLSGTGVTAEEAQGADILLVTMTLTGASDVEGETEETTYVNNFLPVTQTAIHDAYLPEAEPDEENRLVIEYGQAPFYLDQGKPGEQNYFEIATPAEGESVTYTVGYILSQEEYTAAGDGELYLLYGLDAPQKAEDLQLLCLSSDSLQK